MIRRWVDSRWFALTDLACASFSGMWWFRQPGIGGWPLLIVLLPWGVRLAVGRFPFRLTPFDLPLAIFLLTAGIGVWAAYDREIAWAKFWLMGGAVLLYYALAGQPRVNLWIVVGLLSLFGVLVASTFLFSHDWQTQPADIGVVNHLALWWMSVRPPFEANVLDPDVPGGIMAMMFPFIVAWGLRARIDQRRPLVLLAATMGGIVTLASLASGRSTQLTLGAALGIWLLWGLSGQAVRLIQMRRQMIFILALLLLCGWGLLMVMAFPGRLVALLTADNRLEVLGNAFDLAAIFPFTGGGLGAFPGLYSRYILVIPWYYIPHSYNLFLNVAVEQGLFGLLALVTVMLGTGWLLLTWPRQTWGLVVHNDLLRWALVSGLVAMSLQGLVQDSLYSNPYAFLLFLLAGMTVAVTKSDPQPKPEQLQTTRRATVSLSGASTWAGKVAVIAAILVLSVSLFYSFRKPLLSSWYADVGIVQMTRTELAGWPKTRWDEGLNMAALAPAEVLFNQAMLLDPDNRPANYGLGLIAARQGNYAMAVAYLGKVYQADRGNRGLRKTLGYLYVWVGLPDKAAELLTSIPEAEYEMSIYSWWWRTQGRDDLAARAAEMAARLEAISPPAP